MNSAEAPGNWGFSSRDEKCCCCCLWGCWGERAGDSTEVPLAQSHGDRQDGLQVKLRRGPGGFWGLAHSAQRTACESQPHNFPVE